MTWLSSHQLRLYILRLSQGGQVIALITSVYVKVKTLPTEYLRLHVLNLVFKCVVRMLPNSALPTSEQQLLLSDRSPWPISVNLRQIREMQAVLGAVIPEPKPVHFGLDFNTYPIKIEIYFWPTKGLMTSDEERMLPLCVFQMILCPLGESHKTLSKTMTGWSNQGQNVQQLKCGKWSEEDQISNQFPHIGFPVS